MDPVAQALQLQRIGTENQHRRPVRGEPTQRLIDLEARANIDALGRFIDQKDTRIGRQFAREQQLLLVAAGKLRRRRADTRRLDRETLHHLTRKSHFARGRNQPVAQDLRQDRHGEVFRKRQCLEQALGMAVVGDEADAACHRLRTIAAFNFLALATYRAGRNGLQTRKRTQEGALPLAFNTRKADNQAGGQIEGDVIETIAIQTLDRKHHRPVMRCLFRKQPVHRPPGDHRNDRFFADLGARHGSDMPAIADHGDHVRKVEDFTQAVGNIDNGDASRCAGAQKRKQPLHLALAERFRRLIEDQHARLEQQGFGDLDDMPLRNRQLGKPVVRMDRHAAGSDLRQGFGHLTRIGQAGVEAQRDILAHRQVRRQRRMLVNHGHAETTHRSGRGISNDGPVENDLAAIGAHDSGGNIDEGRLARAVLADDGMDLTGNERQAHILQRRDRTIGFGHIAQFHDGTECCFRVAGIMHHVHLPIHRGRIAWTLAPTMTMTPCRIY